MSFGTPDIKETRNKQIWYKQLDNIKQFISKYGIQSPLEVLNTFQLTSLQRDDRAIIIVKLPLCLIIFLNIKPSSII